MDFSLTQAFAIAPPQPKDSELLKKSRLFRSEWYQSTYPDVRISGLDPVTHYLTVGTILLRDPSPEFSTSYYLSSNPDVGQAQVNPLVHFIRFGASEGRKCLPVDGASPISASATVGPDPWLWRLRKGPYLDSVLANPADAPAPIDDRQRALARAALSGTDPRISVIMPTWNREGVVTRALDSIFEQSLAPAEVIVVDDGSEDNTLQVIRKTYPAQIAQGLLKIIEAPHRGVSATRNAGLAVASGDLIAYLDSDNRWLPDYLLFMAAAFAEHDTVYTAYCGLSLNDIEQGKVELRGRPWDRQRLVGVNYIDLNVFMHRRALYDQYGGFDTSLSRLVDWDLVARYTRLYEPVYLPLVGVEYFLDAAGLQNITRTVPLAVNKTAVLSRNRAERRRRGLDTLRIAYVLWDWPALSQTFVLGEIEWLVKQGHDVIVYYKVAPDRAATLNFEVAAHQVDGPEALSALLAKHNRNQIHAHFAFPCGTRLAWPAAQMSGIPFTFFAHAVDIFLENNARQNRIAEMVADPLCQRLFVHGDYHRRFLEGQGVPTEKIAYNFQATDLASFGLDLPLPAPSTDRPLRGMFIGRFVEKKGVPVLLEAAAKLGPGTVRFDLYGYGRDEAQLHQQAAGLNLQNVRFAGPLDDQARVIEAMRAADFLVVPSIVAANGDTEGFPTVILEAMALGLPVVTSDVSAIPDFLTDGITAIVTQAGDSASLAAGIERLAAMPDAQLAAMQARARAFLRERVGTPQTMRTYLDTWLDVVIDIVLVTYDTPEYRDIEHTRAIIDRIRRHTTTPYTLTVIDNGSDPEFLAMLRGFAAQMPNMRLLELAENRFVGGATNIALAASDASFAIYVCSKEGFVQQHGWERALIKNMRDDPEADMGGYFCHMPKYTLGAELQGHPTFGDFRNRDFAAEHPDRPFRHVQGGAFILRRSAVPDEGVGFSYKLPQGNTDTEFSYFLESRGKRLRAFDSVAALTVKTRPVLSAVLDEKVAIAHPLTREAAAALSQAMAAPNASHCNICDQWNGIDAAGRCDRCGSDGLARKLYQRLAHDWRGFRGGKALLTGDPGALATVLGPRMYDLQPRGAEGPFALIVAQTALPEAEARGLIDRLAPGGMLIWPAVAEDWIVALAARPGLRGGVSDRCSRLLRSDWRPLQTIERLPA